MLFSANLPKEPDIMIKLQTFTILCLFATLEAARLPTYLTQCKQSDPNINECLKKSANKGIPHIAKGDIHYDIPSALPLRIKGPIMSKDNNQELIFTDLQIYGLETAKVENAEYIVEKGISKATLEIPSITALASCYAIGNYFGYTVSNHEFLNEKLVDTKINFNLTFTSSEMDGEIFFTNLVHTVKLRAQEQVNEFLRGFGPIKVHKTVCQERFPDVIEKQIGIYINTIVKELVDRVPVSDIFLP